MKTLKLNFAQRVGLSNFLALSQGPLGKMTALQRIYGQVSFSEEEMAQVQSVPMGGGLFRHEPRPNSGFAGEKQVQVQDADAEALKAEMDGRQDMRISDVAWVAAVKEQLAHASDKRKR